MKTGGWRTSLAEIRRFLDTWYFSISAAGHLYVRPLKESITGRDVAAFLRRLDALGESGLPESMCFDFSNLAIPERHWKRITTEIRGYANQINAPSAVLSAGEGRGGRVLILRSLPGIIATAEQCLLERTCQPAFEGV
ncbi:MAG TPA: hypothetical protein VJZ71_19705 [Phycisphaerae bacterium]|nr:hypothetical protein [Phycisphaerae bacterium]